MLIFDFNIIGNKLFDIRKKSGMTQAEVAEASEISTRTYADIERGNVNMRVETVLKICRVLHITPDEILTTCDWKETEQQDKLFKKMDNCSVKDKETALNLLSVFLDSLK